MKYIQELKLLQLSKPFRRGCVARERQQFQPGKENVDVLTVSFKGPSFLYRI